MTSDKCFLPGSSFHERLGKVMYISFLFWFISRKKKVHGYEIIKLLRQEAGFMNVGSAHVYPLLSDLEKHNLLKVEESSEGKRKKKSYSLTPLGKKHISHMKKMIFGSGLRAEFFKEMIQ